MYNYSSSPTVTNCTFSSNYAQSSGGGMYNYSSSPTVTNCTFSNNSNGGMDNNHSSSPTVTNCTFSSNSSTGYGGGMINGSSSSPAVTNCTFSSKSATYGGGMSNAYYSSPTVTNCIFSSNSASYSYGGGMYNDVSSPTVTNCTFSNNSNGGMYNFSASPTVTNCIMWGGDGIVNQWGSAPTVTYCDVSYLGTGNINADPMFGNPYSGYAYDLQPSSPCLNAGTSGAPSMPSMDIVGRPRPNPPGSNPDMGAYEQNADASLAVSLSTFTATASVDGVTLHWRTESEVNNIGFGIYRSEAKDGNYTRIAFVSGAGNSAMPIDYQFTDKKVEVGKTYFYYLEDIDIVGEKGKSETIKVVVTPTKKLKLIVTSDKPINPIPKEFRLLQSFPNPFNPETWIPFKLAKNANVVIRIYSTKGELVRTIRLGNQKAGVYVTKDKAAYWDGKNEQGERVSSGVYFYTLRAGEFKATRRMLIVK
jgi:parallel beta-helix repeat protein